MKKIKIALICSSFFVILTGCSIQKQSGWNETPSNNNELGGGKDYEDTTKDVVEP